MNQHTYTEADIVVQQFRLMRLEDKINTKGITPTEKMVSINEHHMRAKLYNQQVGFKAYEEDYTGGFYTFINGTEWELDYWTGDKIKIVS